ncbi:MAG TPA: hypothetical protein VN132_13995 [Bdellovibrio sp.]|nr:hypothetical protein [Bdellovibrio sp.]
MKLAVCALFFVFIGSQVHAARQSGKIVGEGKKLATIELSQPTGGWTVNRMVEVSGKISDKTINPITVSINGDRYLLKTFDGVFKRKFPVAPGKNTVVVQGANKAGTVKESRVFYSRISNLPFMATLTSDTDGVYTDLHVYEPKASAQPTDEPSVHIYWADTSSESGGKFYLNEQGGSFDQPGYGPYLYTHASPPVGIYRIDANYWPSGDKAHTLGTLNLVLFGGSPSEIRRRVQQPLVMPGETVTLAYVKIEKGNSASIYVPEIDPKPSSKVWPEWVRKAPARKKGDGSAGGEGD